MVSHVIVDEASSFPRNRDWAVIANILVRRQSKLVSVAALANSVRVLLAKRL